MELLEAFCLGLLNSAIHFIGSKGLYYAKPWLVWFRKELTDLIGLQG